MNSSTKLLLNSVYGMHLRKFNERINIKEIFMEEKKVKKIKINFEKEMKERIENACEAVDFLQVKYDSINSDLKAARSYLNGLENALEIYKVANKK